MIYLSNSGFSYLFGGDSRWSIDEAREIFEKLAKTGSPDANLGLGFIYSTGLGLEKPDTARGLLHYTFAALGGNPLAQMAIAYRHYAGINVAENCDAALAWYRRAARKVADNVKLTGSPSVQRIRLPDELVRYLFSFDGIWLAGKYRFRLGNFIGHECFFVL